MLAAAVGCATGNDPSESSGPLVDSSAPESEENQEPDVDPGFVSDLSGLNFNNEDIWMYVAGQSYAKDEFDSFEASGDIVLNAVFRRNTMVESAIGVTLRVDVASDSSVFNVGDKIKALVKSGDQVYDIVTMPGYTQAEYVLEGDYRNLLDIENLNLDKLYWTQGFNGIMSNGNQQYMASGAYSISMIRNMYVTLYNKKIFEERKIPDLYGIAVDGEWTAAKQMELIKDLWTDRNGDGARDKGDFYGFVSGTCTSIDPYWVSFNLPFLQVDKVSGEYSMVVNNEKLVDIFQIMIDLIMMNGDTYNTGGSGEVDGSHSTTSIKKFAEGGCAMTTTTVFMIESQLAQSGFTDDYGIVPMPKFNLEQQEYYTHTQDQLTLMGVVSNVDAGRLPMIGAAMDQLSYYSYKEVFPAYYETALSYKYLQNYESKVMLDIIYRSLKIEGCFLYADIWGLLGTLRGMANSLGSQANASDIKRQTRTWGDKVKKLNKGLADLAG
jgi:hypothetical protein